MFLSGCNWQSNWQATSKEYLIKVISQLALIGLTDRTAIRKQTNKALLKYLSLMSKPDLVFNLMSI